MRISQGIGTGILLVVLIGSFRSVSAQTDNCDIAWSPPAQISFDSVSSNGPQLSVQGDTIHLLWLNTDYDDITSNDGLQYSHSYDGGQTFSSQRKLVGFDSISPSGVFIASQGNFVYALFLASVDTFYGTAFVRSTDAGATWGPIAYLGELTRPILLAAEDSSVYIHFLNQLTNAYGMFRSTNKGTTWQTVAPAMPSLTDMVVLGGRINGVGTIGGRTNQEVAFYSSNDSGANWNTSGIISIDDQTPSILPSIAVNENGHLVVGWNDTGAIIMRRSIRTENDEPIWLPQAGVSDVRGAVFSDIASSGKFVSVVWDNDFGTTGGIRIRSSTNGAASFCPVDDPSGSTSAGGPSVRIAGNTLHVVWSEIVNGNTEVMYRRGVFKAPIAPPTFQLLQNYPNPFNGSTLISYDLSSPSSVELTVYNLLGQKVATLINGFYPALHYETSFAGASLPSGVYFYRLRTTTFSATKKMLLIR